MNRTALLLLPLCVAPGCVIVTHDTTVVYENVPPVLWDGAAWVSWDPLLGDDLVTFEAVVDDADGLGDVIGVWADLYDDGAGGLYVATVELWPTNDPSTWAIDVANHRDGLFLDPTWPGYTVDLWVYDQAEEADALNVPLWTY